MSAVVVTVAGSLGCAIVSSSAAAATMIPAIIGMWK